MLGISGVELAAFPDGRDVCVRGRQGQDDTEGSGLSSGGEGGPRRLRGGLPGAARLSRWSSCSTAHRLRSAGSQHQRGKGGPAVSTSRAPVCSDAVDRLVMVFGV